jgi:hypothetical protein
MARAELESIVAESDPGCVSLSSFHVEKKGAKNIRGTDLYEFTYVAMIESESNCLLVGYAGRTVPISRGFQGAKKHPGEGSFVANRVLVPGEELEVRGKVIFAKTVEGWRSTRGW